MPWPYGLRENSLRSIYLKRLHLYLRVLRISLNGTKTQGLYLGYFRDGPPDREDIPRGQKLGPGMYFRSIATAKFLFSPDGDRPETYRHYEAIGLGTIPVTQMDPHHYRHLQGSAVFANRNWNTSDWNSTLRPPHLTPNRNMVFEEYWMEYAERSCGEPLNWWDADRPATLEDIVRKLVA